MGVIGECHCPNPTLEKNGGRREDAPPNELTGIGSNVGLSCENESIRIKLCDWALFMELVRGIMEIHPKKELWDPRANTPSYT